MPTNFQNASNQLRDRANDQFRGPDPILPPQAVGPNVATPEVVVPPPVITPPVVTPPVITPPVNGGGGIDPGTIVPVNRRRLPRLERKAQRLGYPDFDPTGVVPVDRDAFQAWRQSLKGTDRQDRIRDILSTPRGRQAAATVGGAVMGRRAAATQRRATTAEQLAAARLAIANRPRGTPLSNNPAIPVEPNWNPALQVAAAGPAPGAIAAELPQTNPVAAQEPVATAPSQIDMQQRLQDFISERGLPEAMGTRLTTAAQTMDPNRLAGLLSMYRR